MIAFFWISLALAGASEDTCTVDGHGPYPMTREQCHSQCLNQARANCLYKKKTSRVLMVYKEESLYCEAVRGEKKCEKARKVKKSASSPSL